MSINYLSDSAGEIDEHLPQWQKEMIDRRMKIIENDPQSIMDIDGLFEELDREILISHQNQ